MQQPYLNRTLNWFDQYFLKIAVICLLIFIPLYPKLPLIGVPHTWVYIRLEDIFVTLTYVVWVILFLRKKISLKTPLTFPIILYWIAGGLSLIFTLIFTAKHLANFFPNVSIFHYLRRFEYMGLFFVAFSSVRTKKDLYHYLTATILTLGGIIFYGFGQRLLGFPAFLTMNEEFAKGTPLYLAPTSRLTSTFAGHYDLAIYLVFFIVFLTAIIFGTRKIWGKIIIFLIVFLSLVLLLFTASRISFAVYLGAISLSLWWSNKKKLIPLVLISSIVLMFGVSNMSERFLKTIRVRQVVYDVETGRAIGTLEQAPEGSITTNQKVYVPITTETKESLPVGSDFINLPNKGSDQEATSIATIKKPVLQSLKMSTVSAEIATISGSFLIKKALVYDISLTTRLQGEWPRAIDAFKRNIIFGSGYSSIGLSNDNDYLRSLAETGLAGFMTFLFIFFTIGLFLKESIRLEDNSLVKFAGIGLAAGLVGVMANAVFIDVFEASKVAYTLWLICGIVIGAFAITYRDRIDYKKEIKAILDKIINLLQTNKATLLILLGIAFIILSPSGNIYFTGDDFTWLHWVAKTNTSEEIISFFTQANGFFYRPLAKLAYFGLYNIFWLEPGGYHVASILIHGINVFLVYLIGKKLIGRKFPAFLSALIFSLLAIHSESLFWTAASLEMLAPLFGLLSFWLYISNKKILALISLFFALLGHEGIIILPLLFVAYDMLISHKKQIVVYLTSVIIVLLYLGIRYEASAHWFNGDYSYNLSHLPFNIIGNSLTYVSAVIFGPSVINYFETLRESLRGNISKALPLIGFVIVFGAILVFKIKKKLHPFFIFLIMAFLISLMPYLGLGSVSERYAYFASVWLVLSFGLIVVYLEKRLRKINYYITVMIIMVSISLWNIRQLKQSESEWRKAGTTTYTALASLRNTFIDIKPGGTFLVVDLPIRYGRAWIFPVGFEDGLWHILGNRAPKVQKVPTIDQALELKKGITNSYVFVFDNYEIKEVQ